MRPACDRFENGMVVYTIIMYLPQMVRCGSYHLFRRTGRDSMEEKDLLQKVQKGDEAAFRALFHTYAAPAYQLLLQKCDDKALARALLKHVYRGLKEQEDADPTALWINALAEKRIDAHLFYQKETNAVWQALSPQPALPQATQPATEEATLPPEPVSVQPASIAHAAGPACKRRGGGRVALLCILVAMTACVLWVMAGLLMDVQALPRLDLGYDWFNTAVFQLF